MRNRPQLEEELFSALIALPASERAAFLLSRVTDSEVRTAIESLLREHEDHPEFLAAPAVACLAGDPSVKPFIPAEEQPGALIGPYRLVEKLGEGGCGAVYRAEQLRPVRREVALKIVKLGMDTRAVVARFEAERQALALMEHPGIARVFDAGATATGRPYFAMELVRGPRITAFCDAQRLTIEERLGLFRKVCEALQHAHQKGVIHRDLKPSNILVTGEGAAATPKVIDFGIAKATQGRLAEATIVTELGGLLGTPAYMSPEQAEGRTEAIDTRSDIYSLGLVLYELMAGCTPLDAGEIRRAGVADARRWIHEVEPASPSMRVRAFDAEMLARAAERRRLKPASLREALAGDLDSVVLKCLEKSPGRRYSSANSLAEDIGRYLDGEPVNARPAARWYVWGKFVRRHRGGFAAAAAVFALLTAAAIVSTGLLIRERAALGRATAAERAQAQAREAAEAATRQAKTEATRSARATEFMASVFNGVKPAVARGRDKELLRDLLDEAAARLDTALKDEPEVEAELRDVIGLAFWNLEEPNKSARMHRRALELHEATFGPKDARVGYSLLRLGLFEMYHRKDDAAADGILQRVIDIRLGAFGPADPRTLDAQFFRAETLMRRRQFAEALALFDRIHETHERILPANDTRLLGTKLMRANVLRLDGRVAAAEKLIREFIPLVPDNPEGQILLSKALGSLTECHLDQGRLDEAIESGRRGIALTTAAGQENGLGDLRLAHALHLRGRCEEALPMLDARAGILRQMAGRDSSDRFTRMLATVLVQQGRCLVHLGRAGEAEPLLREACALSWRSSATDVPLPHPAVALAGVLSEAGKREQACEVLENALRQASREGSEFLFQLLPAAYRARQAAQGQPAADALLREQLALEAEWHEHQGPLAASARSLAVLCAVAELARIDLIAPVARARLEWWERHHSRQPVTYAYQTLVGEALLADGQLNAAERMLLIASEGLDRNKGHWPTGPLWLTAHLDRALERFYAACTRSEEPGYWRRVMPDVATDPAWEIRLARILAGTGRYREAREILQTAKTRLEKLLIAKPANDRLAALIGETVSLDAECESKLAMRPEGESAAGRRE